MKYSILKKERLNDFITLLSKNNKVFAPVAKGFNNYAFEQVNSGSEVAAKYIPTILPPKKFFMPKSEVLLEYDIRSGQEMQTVGEREEMILFGVRTCDLAGIQCLNTVFADKPKDANYLVRKNKITIIGLECNEKCDEYASCALMNNEIPNGGYDLFLTDLGDFYYIHINTHQGDQLLNSIGICEEATGPHLQKLKELRKIKQDKFKDEVNVGLNKIPGIFAKSGQSKVWENIGEKCLACGNCTNVCPTCYCFNVSDVPNLDLTTGVRIRTWDSCQSETFAQVAGGESFREERSKRQKHRYYRKFSYPVERYGRFFCTGCGRCSRACMAKINLKETLTELVKENA